MTYCDGGDLQVIIDQNKRRNRLLKESTALHYFVQILLGLQFMHEKSVLHRDIKAQNIFLLGNGRLVLGDLGISKVLNSDRAFAKTAIGTPYYMSPEIYKNNRYDYKSDIWALGCVLYELVTLRHPFDANSMAALGQKVMSGRYSPISTQYSKALRDLVALMLKVNPTQRPSTTQILQMPFIQNHTAEFITDIFTRSSDQMGDGTKVIKQAIVGVAQAHGENVAMTHKLGVDIAQVGTLTNQIEKLGLYELVSRRIAQADNNGIVKPPPPVQEKEVKKWAQDQNRALAREEEKKMIIQAALERLRKEKEERAKRQAALLQRQNDRYRNNNNNPNRIKQAEDRRNQYHHNQIAEIAKKNNQRQQEAQRKREQMEKERERRNEEYRARQEKARADADKRIQREKEERRRQEEEESNNQRKYKMAEDAKRDLPPPQLQQNQNQNQNQQGPSAAAAANIPPKRLSYPPRAPSYDEERDQYQNHLKVKEVEEQMKNQKYRNYRDMGSDLNNLPQPPKPSVDLPPVIDAQARRSNHLPPVTRDVFRVKEANNALLTSPMNSRDYQAAQQRAAARCESAKSLDPEQEKLAEMERIRLENIRINQEAALKKQQQYRSDNIIAQMGMENPKVNGINLPHSNYDENNNNNRRRCSRSPSPSPPPSPPTAGQYHKRPSQSPPPRTPPRSNNRTPVVPATGSDEDDEFEEDYIDENDINSEVKTADDGGEDDEAEAWEQNEGDDEDIDSGPDELEEREEILKSELKQTVDHINLIHNDIQSILRQANVGIPEDDTGSEGSDEER